MELYSSALMSRHVHFDRYVSECIKKAIHFPFYIFLYAAECIGMYESRKKPVCWSINQFISFFFPLLFTYFKAPRIFSNISLFMAAATPPSLTFFLYSSHIIIIITIAIYIEPEWKSSFAYVEELPIYNSILYSYRNLKLLQPIPTCRHSLLSLYTSHPTFFSSSSHLYMSLSLA